MARIGKRVDAGKRTNTVASVMLDRVTRLSIRLANPADVPAMARVHVAAVAQLCRSNYGPEELARWTNQGPELYMALVRSATVMVAERDGAVVGFAAASLATGFVRAVYVAPGHAGVWQAAEPLGEYSLTGACVGPGFEFTDFRMLADEPGAKAALAGARPDLVRLL